MTQMMLESGQTGMVGGLTTDVENETQTRVPYLSKIPILGELFKHRSKTKDKRSLLDLPDPDPGALRGRHGVHPPAGADAPPRQPAG